MKKRALSIFLVLCLVCSALSAIGFSTSAQGMVWDGSTDTSWYDASKTEFTLTTPEQLAGFAAITNGTADGIALDTFAGKTVKLGADMVLNEGDASTWTKDTAGLNEFPKIGNNKDSKNEAAFFQGEFDGQGHTISGVYVKTKQANYGGVGLFSGIYSGASVHDFALVNSYFYQPDNRFAGSVVGYAYTNKDDEPFKVYNIYSDATVVSVSASGERGLGGIIGHVNASAKGATTANEISSCVFAGRVSYEGSYRPFAGSMVGITRYRDINITNCLNMGTVSSGNGNPYIGGFIGYLELAECVIKLDGCVNAVSPVTTTSFCGELYCYNGSGPVKEGNSVSDCFYVGTRKGVNIVNSSVASANTHLDAGATKLESIDALTGLNVSSDITTALDGWILRDGDIMIPAAAAHVTPSTPSNYAPQGSSDVVFRGVQQSAAAEGKLNLRFVATLNSEDYSEVGYKVSYTYDNGTDTVSQPEKAFSTNTVYEKILATENGMTKEYTAAGFSAKYIYVMTIKNVPASGTVTFTVTPYTVSPDGNTTTEYTAYTVTYVNGACSAIAQK